MAHIRQLRHGLTLRKLYSQDSCPARFAHVAIVGSGPAGFYSAQHILKVSPKHMMHAVKY